MTAGPGPDCPRCPRLVEFRERYRGAEPAWHNAPVPSFGDLTARLLIVGLAPGLKGANRTGRPFTGDYAGDLLYATLKKFEFAAGEYAAVEITPDGSAVARVGAAPHGQGHQTALAQVADELGRIRAALAA